MSCGAVAVGWAVGQLADGFLYQHRAAARLARVRAGLPCGLPEAEAVPRDGARTENARIEIPRIDIGAMISSGDDLRTLRRGVGRIPGTATFDQVGNVGLAAHRDTYFRGLRRVAVGDTIRIETESGEHYYIVEWTRIVQPEAIEVLDPTPTRALTLVTCYPFNYVGAAPQRFIVRARGIPRPLAPGQRELQRADGGFRSSKQAAGNRRGASVRRGLARLVNGPSPVCQRGVTPAVVCIGTGTRAPFGAHVSAQRKELTCSAGL